MSVDMGFDQRDKDRKKDITEIHYHYHYPELDMNIKKVLENQNLIIQKLDKIMALDQESLDLLVEINDATTEIGDDITTLINKPDATAADFKTALRPIADKLKGIAAQYTADTPL